MEFSMMDYAGKLARQELIKKDHSALIVKLDALNVMLQDSVQNAHLVISKILMEIVYA